MPHPSPLTRQWSLIALLLVLLGCGFLATSLASYYTALDSIRAGIINTELPLTSDNVYSEIQKDLVRPILISSMMSRDTYVRDWVLSGEKDPEQVQEDEPRDDWYFRVRDMQTPYEINVDVDMANDDRMTVFINYKVFDYQQRFIGATGVGLTVDAVVKLIDTYQQRYERSVFFVDTNGRLVLTGANGGPMGARVGQSLSEIPGLEELQAKLPHPQSGDFEYQEHGRDHFLNVRFIPELNWYLFVDKHEDGAVAGIRKSLYLNLLICLVVTVIVISLVSLVLRRYQRRISALATTDLLTELPNRRGFDLLANQAVQEARRSPSALCALMLDLDNFKQLNDSQGHMALAVI